jgi:hypothetical protein
MKISTVIKGLELLSHTVHKDVSFMPQGLFVDFLNSII